MMMTLLYQLKVLKSIAGVLEHMEQIGLVKTEDYYSAV